MNSMQFLPGIPVVPKELLDGSKEVAPLTNTIFGLWSVKYSRFGSAKYSWAGRLGYSTYRFVRKGKLF